MKFLNPVTLSVFHFGVTILHFYPLFNYSSHLALLVSIANRASQQQPAVSFPLIVTLIAEQNN